MKHDVRILAISDHTEVGPMALRVHGAWACSAIWACSPLAAKPMFSRIVDVKKDWQWIIDNFDLVFSYHCKQIFPPELVEAVRCINVHPGYNPFNRGWFPSQFSIWNGLPAGVTIHEMDEGIDSGNIIVREQIELTDSDTSDTAYGKIMQLEEKLLMEWLPRLVSGDYTAAPAPEGEGNYNSKGDHAELCNLTGAISFHKPFFNRLRALSHGGYRNGYFIDRDGKKVYVSLKIEKETSA